MCICCLCWLRTSNVCRCVTMTALILTVRKEHIFYVSIMLDRCNWKTKDIRSITNNLKPEACRKQVFLVVIRDYAVIHCPIKHPPTVASADERSAMLQQLSTSATRSNGRPTKPSTPQDVILLVVFLWSFIFIMSIYENLSALSNGLDLSWQDTRQSEEEEWRFHFLFAHLWHSTTTRRSNSETIWSQCGNNTDDRSFKCDK